MLTTTEAARRLGVKPETLYAYVSPRAAHPPPRAGRPPLPVRARGDRAPRRPHAAAAAAPARLELIVDTELTLLDPAGAPLLPRPGRHRLARESTLRGGRGAAVGRRRRRGAPVGRPRGDFAAPSAARRPAATACASIVALAAAADPLRADLRPPAVRHTRSRADRGDGRRAARGVSEPADASIAARLWSRVHDEPPPPDRLRALDGALILLADHELALSALVRARGGSAHGPTRTWSCSRG